MIRRGQRVGIAIGDRVAVDHRIGADDQRAIGAVNGRAEAIERYGQRTRRVDARDRHGLDVACTVRIGQRECAMRHFAWRVRIRADGREPRFVHKVVACGNVGFTRRRGHRDCRRRVLVNMHIDGAGNAVAIAIGQVGCEGQIRICGGRGRSDRDAVEIDLGLVAVAVGIEFDSNNGRANWCGNRQAMSRGRRIVSDGEAAAVREDNNIIEGRILEETECRNSRIRLGEIEFQPISGIEIVAMKPKALG